MAGLNEILVGRYNRFFQKLMSMKGAATVSELASEVVPSFPLYSGVENRYLEQWDLFSVSVQVSAVGGQFGRIQIRNPVGSNVIAVVYSATCSTIGAAAAFFSPILSKVTTNADLAATTNYNGFNLDARARAAGNLIFSQGTDAGLASNALMVEQSQTGTTVEFISHEGKEIPLLPGDALIISLGTANFSVQGGFSWRERLLEESERK